MGCPMWVIYNTNTWRLYNGRQYSGKMYATERAAKAQLTKLTKGLKPELDAAEWTVAPVEQWEANQPTVTVTNLMTGKPVHLKASQVGGVLDPSMERYWAC